jgi:hypothetical protein
MAEAKFKPTGQGVESFLDGQELARRADCVELVAMMRRATGAEPRLWSANIVGFGDYHYRYASGHEGDACLVGFSPRKTEFSIYLAPGFDGLAPLLAKLGKHRMGKGCLYVKRLADIDRAVLEQLIVLSVAHLRQTYPA